MSLLFLNPASGVKAVGTTFRTTVAMDGPDIVNAAQVNMTFPAALLEAQSIDYSDSAMGLQAESVIGPGFIRMARSVNPGGQPISGQKTFGLITFKVLAEGEAFINFDSTSAIIRASDSLNVLTVRHGAYLWLGSVVRSGLNIVIETTINSFQFLRGSL